MKHIVRFIRKLIFRLSAVILIILLLIGGFFGVKGYNMYQSAINDKSLEERVEEVRSTENFTAYADLPQFYIDATISVEDHRFKEHWGIDPIAIGRAVWTDIRAMSFVEGGSTITQQLAKNLLFTQEKKLERKAAEVFAALEMESQYTKEEIFELYANTVYFGNGYYGIGEAAVGYFGKNPWELNDYECVLLAGIPNEPSVYSPDADNGLALRRMKKVLDSMVKNKMITQEESDRIELDKK